MTPLDPETERHVRALDSFAADKSPGKSRTALLQAAAHMRKLATERDTANALAKQAQHERDAAQRELAETKAALAQQIELLHAATADYAETKAERDRFRGQYTIAERELRETKAELERLREAVRWLNSSSWWRPWHESLGKDPAAALIRLHERNKP